MIIILWLCMNNWQEKYPSNLQKLVEENLETATKLEKALNSDNCPLLSDLYKENNDIVKRQVSIFKKLGYQPNVKGNKKVKSENEFRGLYVFGEEINGKVRPVYVGISRTIFRRLRQHGWGSEHNQCTLAYLIAIDKYYNNKYSGERKAIIEELKYGREKVQNFKVALIHIPEDFDLYFLEATLAGHWKTKWNSFRTH